MLLDDLNVVIKVAEFRNITAAATHLNMRTATASAAVKRVEQALVPNYLFVLHAHYVCRLRVKGFCQRAKKPCQCWLMPSRT